MICRSSGISLLHIRHAIKSCNAATRCFHSSPLRRSSPSVAAVLATPPTHDQHIVTVVGSVRTVRNQKHLTFVELGDGSTVQSLQAVLEPSQAKGYVLSTLAFIELSRPDINLDLAGWARVLRSRSPASGDLPLHTKNRATS